MHPFFEKVPAKILTAISLSIFLYFNGLPFGPIAEAVEQCGFLTILIGAFQDIRILTALLNALAVSVSIVTIGFLFLWPERAWIVFLANTPFVVVRSFRYAAELASREVDARDAFALKFAIGYHWVFFLGFLCAVYFSGRTRFSR